MDPIDAWRDLIERILSEHAAVPYANCDARSYVLFDRTHDRYALMDVGWRGAERVHGALVHVDILDGKVWVQYDGTEYGVAQELVDAGVPKDRIVLASKPEWVRPHTGFDTA